MDGVKEEKDCWNDVVEDERGSEGGRMVVEGVDRKKKKEGRERIKWRWTKRKTCKD